MKRERSLKEPESGLLPEQIQARVRAYYDNFAPRYTDVVRKAEYAVPGWIAERVGELDRPRVLDLGCGNGNLGVVLADLGVPGPFTGVDLSPKMAAEARATGLYEQVHCHDLSLGLPREVVDAAPFDLVLAFGFTDFLAQPVRFIERVGSVLVAETGRMWVSFEQSTDLSVPCGHIEEPHGMPAYHYERQSVIDMVRGARLRLNELDELDAYLRTYDSKLVTWLVVDASRPLAGPCTQR